MTEVEIAAVITGIFMVVVAVVGGTYRIILEGRQRAEDMEIIKSQIRPNGEAAPEDRGATLRDMIDRQTRLAKQQFIETATINKRQDAQIDHLAKIVSHIVEAQSEMKEDIKTTHDEIRAVKLMVQTHGNYGAP